MADKAAGQPRRGRPEALHYLDRIAAGYPEARLLVDLAREAVIEDAQRRSRREQKLQGRLARLAAKREVLKNRLVGVLRSVLTGAAVLPRPAGQPPVSQETLAQEYRQLRTHDFPELAALLQSRAGHSTVA